MTPKCDRELEQSRINGRDREGGWGERERERERERMTEIYRRRLHS